MKKLLFWLRDKKDDFWVIPAIFVAAAILLSTIIIDLDRAENLSFGLLFDGTPSAARSLLSTIAGASITVVSIAFSVTVVAVQQVATQYSSRVIRTFTSDKGNQFVLGIYLATFTFSLLVLGSIRDSSDTFDQFVPNIATSFSIILALLSVATLVYFIHHITLSLQLTSIVHRIYGNSVSQIASLYPNELGEPYTDKDLKKLYKSRKTIVHATSTGFVTRVLELQSRELPTSKTIIKIVPSIGEFVYKTQVIAEIYGDMDTDKSEQLKEGLLQSIMIAAERSDVQDVMYVFQQLVDVSIKALSPGINDPTSAEYAINYISAALTSIGKNTIPINTRVMGPNKNIIFVVSSPGWDDMLDACYSQILYYSRSSPAVQSVLARRLIQMQSKVLEKNKKEIDVYKKILLDYAIGSDYDDKFKKKISTTLS